MKEIYLFFSFVSLIQFCFSQLLVTSNDKVITAEKIKEKYNKILNKYLPTMLMGIEYENVIGQCNNATLTFYNFTYQDLKIEPVLPYFYFPKNIIVYSNSITLFFNYDIGIEKGSEKTKYQSSFIIQISSVTFEEKEENNTFKSEVSIETKKDDYVTELPAEFPIEYEECANTILFEKFIEKNEDLLNSKFQMAVQEGFANFYLDISKMDFHTSDFFGSIYVNVSFNTFCGLCKTDPRHQEGSAQCYFMGNVTSKLYHDKKNDSTDNPNFTQENGKMKMFINNQLVTDVMSLIIDKNNKYLFNDKNKPSGYHKKINVENLLYYFPKIYSIAPRSLYFTVTNILVSFNMTQGNNGVAAVNHIFDLGEEGTRTILLQSIINFHLKINTFATSFNLCLDDFNVIKVKKLTVGPLSVMQNVNELKNEIQTLLSLFFKNNPICLIDEKGIDLIDYIKLIEEYSYGNKGIYIEGEQMDLY